ncbi:hypothetical protein YC2023_040285 [Brassica napus]
MSFVEMQIEFIKDENHIYRVYIGATNQEHLCSSDLRCGHEEFTSEKIEYEQTHGAKLRLARPSEEAEEARASDLHKYILGSTINIWKQTFLVTRDETLMLPEYSFGDNTPETLSLLK